jgi:hypothetical protein
MRRGRQNDYWYFNDVLARTATVPVLKAPNLALGELGRRDEHK